MKFKDLTHEDKINFIKEWAYCGLDPKNKVMHFENKYDISQRSVYYWLDNIALDLYEDDSINDLKLVNCINTVYTKKTKHVDVRRSTYTQGDDFKKEDSFFVKGTSTLYDVNGDIKLQWVKTQKEYEDKYLAFKNAIDSLMENIDKSYEPKEFSKYVNEDLMSVYTIGDAHIGMLAHKDETGESHDLKLAEEDLINAMEMLVAQSNPTEECFIIDVGDYFHSDNKDNKTAKSGNVLDVDGRYHKVLDIGLLLTVKLIEKALTKHKTVRWRSAIGNHNEHSAIMMSSFIKAWFRNEPRVIVHDTPNMMMYHQFGKNLIGVTHGHTTKITNLPEIMACDCEDIWSSTKYRYWYTGHIHHDSSKEFRTCKVETFRTLAPKDAWHSASGYRSGQDMKCICLHKDYGEISRNTVNIDLVRNTRG